MRGTIVNFSVKDNTGIISGEDLQRYNFTLQDWKDTENPAQGVVVDFDTDENDALEIYVISENDAFSSKFLNKTKTDRYYRIPNQAVIAGVCAGIALKWGVSRTALRWTTAILTLFFLPLALVYIVLWAFFPVLPGTEVSTVEAKEPQDKANDKISVRSKIGLWVLGVCVVLVYISENFSNG